jgi:hypothetical protein
MSVIIALAAILLIPITSHAAIASTCDQEASVHGKSIHSSPNTGNCSAAASVHANPVTGILAGSHNDPGFNTANCGSSASSKAGQNGDGDNGQHGKGAVARARTLHNFLLCGFRAMPRWLTA